jgi:glycosyltransferase involved in cell wall biosynthesis
MSTPIVGANSASFFSICIPQFNRTSFLLRCLQRLKEQTMREFEICISDGGSTDGRQDELLKWLRESGLSFRYCPHNGNLPYDPNLRAAIAMATGRYCFLLGNDDMLATHETLEEVRKIVIAHEFPEAVVANYHELSTGRDLRRVSKTGIIGSGMEAAISNFRNYSFVSGVLLDRQLAQDQATEKWDGSEMYQTFLATRILAGGGRLLGIADTVILKDIQIEGEQVDSYARRERVAGPIRVRSLPLAQLGVLVMDALGPHLDRTRASRISRRVFGQLLLYTYPPWLIEYRRVQSWHYAAGVALGMRPRILLNGLRVGVLTSVALSALYGVVTLAGMTLPIRLFEAAKPYLHRLAKGS